MRRIDNGIVFSNDIYRILNGKNALDFNYKERGMVIPSKDEINFLRENFKKDVNRIFEGQVEIIEEKDMESYMYEVLNSTDNVPIVSLDRVYLDEDASIYKDIYFIDCTRINNSKELVPRKENNPIPVSKQIEIISKKLKEKKQTNIFLFDDVVFSGNVLKNIINQFQHNNISVKGIRACISTEEAYRYFNENMDRGLKCGCLLGTDVIDQICERDFYLGIAQSGISVVDKKGIMYKAPYFKPFGNPEERASIPKKYETFFSNSCLLRSLYLWKKIEDNTGRPIYMKDLPEKIKDTNGKERILDVLRKGLIYDEKNPNRDNGFSR